jgi:hypothetical protein
MKTIRSFALILMSGILSLSACSALAVQPVPPVATVQPTPTIQTVPPVSGAPDGSLTVTLADEGKTISLAVGDSFLLNLGETYNWDVTISDQSILSRVIGITVIRGAQGIYQAHQAGSVTLRASGDPQCRQSVPACGMPSRLFTVTVLVK